MQLEITPQQAEFLIKCVDLAVRNQGLKVAGEALQIVTRLQHAVKDDKDAVTD